VVVPVRVPGIIPVKKRPSEAESPGPVLRLGVPEIVPGIIPVIVPVGRGFPSAFP